eukprot:Rhum_TRINITY_DN15476_c1_g1::Rhum_TRINITY_DN15476_c1_g1_i14::g.160106::m.160106
MMMSNAGAYEKDGPILILAHTCIRRRARGGDVRRRLLLHRHATKEGWRTTRKSTGEMKKNETRYNARKLAHGRTGRGVTYPTSSHDSFASATALLYSVCTTGQVQPSMSFPASVIEPWNRCSRIALFTACGLSDSACATWYIHSSAACAPTSSTISLTSILRPSRHVPHHHRRRRLLRHRVVAQRRDRPRLPRRKQAAHVPQHRPEDRVLLQRRTPDVAHQRRRRAHRHRHVEHPGHRVLHRPHVHRQQRSLLLVPVAHADRVEAQAHPVPAQVVHHPVQRTRVLHNLLHVRRVHREHLAAAVQRSQEPTQVAVRCRHTLPPCQVARLCLLLRVHRMRGD